MVKDGDKSTGITILGGGIREWKPISDVYYFCQNDVVPRWLSFEPLSFFNVGHPGNSSAPIPVGRLNEQ